MPLGIKDIQETIRSLDGEGIPREQLEALLMNSDDLKCLLQSIYENNENVPPISSTDITNNADGIQICGVKIIENPYMQPGSILKVFKNGPLNTHLRGFGFNRTVTMPEKLKIPTVADEKKENNRYSDKRRIDL